VSSASATSAIQNNIVGGFSTGAGPTFGYSFIGIASEGASGNFTISDNTIGSTSLANSIMMGDANTTTGVCTINGIDNVATLGTIAINNNIISNASVFGTGGTSTGISNTAAAATLSINTNIIRNFTINNTTANFTGIVNSGAVSTSIAINNNLLGDATGGLVSYSVANSGALLGISNTAGTSAATLSIQNNDIRGIVHSVAGSSAHNYIINSAATLSQNISGNTFTNLNVNTNGAVMFIKNYVALPANGVQTINNNSIVTGFTKTGTLSSVIIFETYATSNASATITNSGNNFSNINIAGSSSTDGWMQGDQGSGTKTVSNNVFRNWTIGSGIATPLWVEDTGINKTEVFNNTIDGITTADGIQAGIVLVIKGVLSCYGNTVTNLAATRTDISLRVEGIRILGFAVANSAEPNKIYNNTVSGLFNAGGVGDNRTVGIGTSGGAKSFVFSIYNNTISNISTSGTGNHQLFPLFLFNCKTGNAYNNKIYNISSTGIASPTLPTVTGIAVFLSSLPGGGTWNVYNNLVSDLRAPNTSNKNSAVVGVYFADDNAGFGLQSGLCNLYFNTINLNASSTVSDFGTAGIYHGNTGIVLDMRNNIINNTSTASGTGKITALLRSAAGTRYGTTYSSTSNNNLFYAGLPSVSNNLLSPDGITITQTLAELKMNLAPRESNTTSGAVSFLSLDGTSSDFLRPNFTNSATSALINDKATSISSITKDFAGITRGTLPDIGAYEWRAVVSAYVCNTASTGTMTMGVPVSGVTQTITATVTTIGTYNITAVANGVTFSGIGTFAATGDQSVVLTATGTPIATGINSFILNTAPNCSFDRTTVAN
jgi:hypothetical protein